jgi:2-haloacid dehalogenase
MAEQIDRRRIIVFDVNETLLDIEALSPFFAKVFGDARIMRQWFAELILYSQAVTLGGKYADFDADFGKLAVAVLSMVADIRSVALGDDNVADFAQIMKTLPAHPEAKAALERLRDAGFRLVTLTNSAPGPGKAVLEQAGLHTYFDRQFSVDAVKRFKPAPEVYRMVSDELNVEPRALRLVAAHTWDILGAQSAGWAGALVRRPGNAPLPLGEQPDIVEPDLLSTADRIIELDE